ncbi:MAG: flagellar hook-associated protein 3 [Desulfobacteraceae bacterium]|nr:flagellar hook-associated protein 3 [Desulfobacteraceae bacterium]
MRVPNISIYANSTYNLGKLTSALQDANLVIATEKRINHLSDDPIGFSQALNLKTSLENLEQIEKNVNMGFSWLKGGENSLESVKNLILEIKNEVIRFENASMNADQLKDAVGLVNGMIEQLVTLGNTQINGSYIFGGTQTDTLPFIYNQDTDPASVSYVGNNTAFEIKTDNQMTVPVGGDGEAIFWEDKVEISSYNNTIVFMEDNGHGSSSQIVMEAIIDDGTYTTDTLEVAVKNALNEASSTDGYGMTYEVEYDEDTKLFSIREDGSYDGYLRTQFMWETGEDAYVTGIAAIASIDPDDISLSVVNENALTISTPEPKGTEPFRLTWLGDDTWEIENNPGYIIIPSTISGSDKYIGIDLDESGVADITISLDTPVTSVGQYIEFEIVSAQGDHSLGHEIGFNGEDSTYAPPTSDTSGVYVTELIITAGTNDTIDFAEVNSAGVTSGTLTADFNLLTSGAAVTYTDMDSLAAAIESSMEAASVNGINYAVSYDVEQSKFNIREDGSSLNELQVLWSNTTGASTTAATLGYYPLDDIISYPSSDNVSQLYVTLDSTNNRIAFEETAGAIPSGILWGTVAEGTYKDMADLEAAVKTSLEAASAASGYSATYAVSYDDATDRFSIQYSSGGAVTDFDLLWSTANAQGSSMGETLGFEPADDTSGGIAAAYVGDSDMVLMTFDDTNNVIDFRETSIDGTLSDEISITISEGDYTDLDDVATDIQIALRAASPNNVKYVVTYDYTAGEFTIKGSDEDIKGISLLWQTGDNRDESAADLLGFYGDDQISFSESDEEVVNITIDSTNNKIDFMEILEGEEDIEVDALTASLEVGKTYTSHSQLALEVEKALEEESYTNGNHIDYSVTWDSDTKHFTIKESGTKLAQFDLLWGTGDNAPVSAGGGGGSIGATLGFAAEDDVAAPVESERQVAWGIFDTLIDLNGYLEDNDADGIGRTIERLATHFESFTSETADIGITYNRLLTRQRITAANDLSLTERKSTIEDVDIIEAVMNLQSLQTAYQASLSSSAKIMNLSLVDYL